MYRPRTLPYRSCDAFPSAAPDETSHGYPHAAVPTELRPYISMNNAMVPSTLQLPAMSSCGPSPSLPGFQSYQPHPFDHTGQVAPPGMKPRVTATLWEDEGSLCFQVEAKGVCVARREDNHMINGTKLLNVAGMTRGRRDGILKAEKTRHIVKIGPMHLKGVWIPFDRALEFANKEKITEQLYPLFVHDIGALLYHPSNQTRASIGGAAMAAVDRNRRPDPLQAQRYISGPTTSQPSSLHHHHRHLHSISNPIGAAIANHDTPTRNDHHIHDFFEIKENNTYDPITSTLEDDKSFNGRVPREGSPSQGHGQVPGYQKKAAMEDAGSDDKHVAEPYTPSATETEGSTSVSLESTKRQPCRGSASNVVPSNGSDLLSSDPKHQKNVSLETECEIGLEPATREPYGRAASICDSEELEDTISSDTSASDGNIDGGDAIEAQKEAILTRLMLCVHNIFTQTGYTSCGQQSPASSSVPVTGDSKGGNPRCPSGNGSNQKRGIQQNEDDDDGQASKKQRTMSRAFSPDQELQRKLACPYYKNDPTKCRSSGACCGPGWGSVHRIKAHIYRVHAMPLHCRRCYVTFENEVVLTEHSRSASSCPVRSPIPMEGFDKAQERALKARKTMFQAGSEEEKWKIVYLILFPDTPLGELPSPYYDFCTAKEKSHTSNDSPKPPELKQFDAFLKRELPRTIRKKLQAFLEDSFGPIEETIKNELEGIVRDAQEVLTRRFLGTGLPEDQSIGTTSRLVNGDINAWQSGVSQAGPSEPIIHLQPQMDALAPYFVPPDATGTALPNAYQLAANDYAYEAPPDSGYYSHPIQDPPFDEDWLNAVVDDDTWTRPSDENVSEDVTRAGLRTGASAERGPETSYTGKGKGRAMDNTFGDTFEDAPTA